MADDDSATGYWILRRRPPMDETKLPVYVEYTCNTATTFADTEVTAGIRHVYRVQAINPAGVGKPSNYVCLDRRAETGKDEYHQSTKSIDAKDEGPSYVLAA